MLINYIVMDIDGCWGLCGRDNIGKLGKDINWGC